MGPGEFVETVQTQIREIKSPGAAGSLSIFGSGIDETTLVINSESVSFAAYGSWFVLGKMTVSGPIYLSERTYMITDDIRLDGSSAYSQQVGYLIRVRVPFSHQEKWE